jgi:hypothetical protein
LELSTYLNLHWLLFFEDSRRISKNPQMEPTLQLSSRLVRKLNPFRISGGTTTTLLSIRSRCANRSTCSSKVFSPYGKIEETSTEEVGRLEFQKSMALTSGREFSWWPLERNFKAALMLVSHTESSRKWLRILIRNSGDQLCGVGLSVRFNSHLISVWHRDASQQKSIDALLATVLEELPTELKPKPDNYFYKKHSDHAGFKAPAVAAPPVVEVKKA